MKFSKILFCFMLFCASPWAFAKGHHSPSAPLPRPLVEGQTILIPKSLRMRLPNGNPGCQILQGGYLTVLTLNVFQPVDNENSLRPGFEENKLTVEVAYHPVGAPGVKNECGVDEEDGVNKTLETFHLLQDDVEAYAKNEAATRVLLKKATALAQKAQFKVEHPYRGLKFSEILRLQAQAEAQVRANCGNRLVRFLDDSRKVAGEGLTLVGETGVQLAETAPFALIAVLGGNVGHEGDNLWSYSWFKGLRSQYSGQRQGCWDAVAQLGKIKAGWAEKMKEAAASSSTRRQPRSASQLSKNLSSPVAARTPGHSFNEGAGSAR